MKLPEELFDPPDATSAAMPCETVASPPIRILVADDDAAGRADTLRHLAALGYVADVAVDGEAALQASMRTAYDVIFMDCHMPRLDGYSATQQIRERAAHFRQPIIVALTAEATAANREKCRLAGMDHYLTKPVNTDDLARHLANWPLPQQTSAIRELKPEDQNGRDAAESKLIRLFLSDAPKRLAAMRAAIVSGESGALQRVAHTFKGSSGVVGAADLAKTCEILETLGEAGTLGQAEAHLVRCEAEFALVSRTLTGKLAKIENGRDVSE